MEKGITARHCPALIPPFYYHLTPFNGSPHFPSSSAHTICSQPPSSDSVKSVIQPGLSRWGGRVLGGVTSMVVLGGVRPFSDPNFIYSPQLDSGGPLCWDWWPAVVRETNTLLKQAYMNITGRLVMPFMDVSQMTAFLESKCILVQCFHCVNDKIHYKSTLKFMKVIKIPNRVSFPPCIVFNSIPTWKWRLWKWHFQHFW